MSDLKPGKYRMTVEVEVDEEGYLLPHDSGEMFMADWWVQNDATFEPVPRPQCNECGWWLTTNPASCPSCGTPTGLGVSGEDRSEPTPAPREWREGDTEPSVGYDLLEDAEGDRITRTVNGWVWTRVEGKDYGVTPWSPGKAWSELPWSDVGGGVLSEVVTPEGTP